MDPVNAPSPLLFFDTINAYQKSAALKAAIELDLFSALANRSASAAELATALRRAAAAHGEHEKRNGGQHDENWPDWYAEYMVRELSGKPQAA